jgi:hypothetical protein
MHQDTVISRCTRSSGPEPTHIRQSSLVMCKHVLVHKIGDDCSGSDANRASGHHCVVSVPGQQRQGGQCRAARYCHVRFSSTRAQGLGCFVQAVRPRTTHRGRRRGVNVNSTPQQAAHCQIIREPLNSCSGNSLTVARGRPPCSELARSRLLSAVPWRCSERDSMYNTRDTHVCWGGQGIGPVGLCSLQRHGRQRMRLLGKCTAQRSAAQHSALQNEPARNAYQKTIRFSARVGRKGRRTRCRQVRTAADDCGKGHDRKKQPSS